MDVSIPTENNSSSNRVWRSENGRRVLLVSAICLKHIEMPQLVNETSTSSLNQLLQTQQLSFTKIDSFLIQYLYQSNNIKETPLNTTQIIIIKNKKGPICYSLKQKIFVNNSKHSSILLILSRFQFNFKIQTYNFTNYGCVFSIHSIMIQIYCAQILIYKQFLIHLQQATMSSKLQLKPLLAKHHLSSQHSLITNQNQTYNSYQQQLETNLRIILKRFHNLDKTKVQNLLEELDNNLELAIQILQQEIQSSNRIFEQKKQQTKKLPNLTQSQQNQFIKQAFLNLYKKYIELQKKHEEEVKKNDSYKQEIDGLRLMNKLLLEGEYSQVRLEQNRDIC